MDSTYDVYVADQELEKWLDLNAKYFSGDSHKRLVPRGLLLEGMPGTGKTMAAKVISRRLGVPLYRLDVATVLDKYIGVSENRVARILSLVEREAPCVLLIGEVEKLFAGSGEDSGVTSRILSQLLWWLQEHQSLVFTVMTSNKTENVPPELYRSGRLDARIEIQPLKTVNQCVNFTWRVLTYMLGKTPTPDQVKIVDSRVEELLSCKAKPLAHAELTELVMTEIKRNSWL